MIQSTKLTRRVFNCIVAFALAIALFPTVNVKAAENVPTAPTDYGDPIVSQHIQRRMALLLQNVFIFIPIQNYVIKADPVGIRMKKHITGQRALLHIMQKDTLCGEMMM